MEIKGKVAFVTGGAMGIGRAVVEALLSKGARVLFCDVIQSLGETTEKEHQDTYGVENVAFTLCDVSDTSQLSAAFQKTVDMFGRVDIHVNNAGIMKEDDMDKTVAVNQLAYMHGTAMAEKHMRHDAGGQGGVIVNIASLAGLYSIPECPSYAATKHAVIGFSSSMALRQQGPQSGVRIVCVCPAVVDTEMTRANTVTTENKIPLANPSVIGEAVVKVVQDPDNNGGLLEVWSRDSIAYRRRLVVDADGVGNPLWSAEPLMKYMVARYAAMKS